MNISENKNFKSVSVYNGISRDDLKSCGKSFHMNDRDNRMSVVRSLEKTPIINRCFLVDKGHKNGQELHVVTNGGMIYIYNFMKLFYRQNNALVTVLIARPNQIKRLYEACNLMVDNAIMENARMHSRMKLNNA